MLDVAEVYKVQEWYKHRDPDQDVGIFIVLPEKIAKQFPEEGKSEEDTSPSHVTFFYLGELKKEEEKKYLEIIKRIANFLEPFDIELGDVNTFVNEEKQTIIHSPVEGKGLMAAHSLFKKIFSKLGLKYADKYPEYKPHVTIEYVNEGEKPRFGDVRPEGKWTVDHLWIWGTQEPYMVSVG
jgi:2'-5' RNA ligase